MIAAKLGDGTKKNRQSIHIDDLRGSNAPFGHSHVLTPEEGDLYMWPSWSSHMVTPQVDNATNVFFSFICWPEGGTTGLDWEDDPSSDYKYIRNSKINRTPKQPESKQEL